ncbi:hypothetical protein QUA00_22780 [Microcoleus sp. T2B6]|uniref:hypothetical protein n=1 Tax=Microcoleus sp. T2B6 TaxID=3055424 RepID=UPI002FD0305F
MPVHKRIIENGATYELELTSCTIINKCFTGGQDADLTRRDVLFVEQARCLLLRIVQDVSYKLCSQ